MKTLLIFACFLLSLRALITQQMHQNSSVRCDMVGDLITKEEEVLNALLASTRGDFDFHGKKIAFISGNSGNRILTQQAFFNSCINPWLNENKVPNISMIILSSDEKKSSGGYDVLVLSWVKIFTNKQRKRIISQLSEI